MARLTDLYWLAGLLEAEGSFLAGPPSKPNCPQIQLQMTDRDVVEHAAGYFGRRAWRSDRGHEFGYKPVFLTAIKGAAAVELMTALKPVMGIRRRSQIANALARPHAHRVRWFRPAAVCSVAACSRSVHAKGLCKTHYGSWWKSAKRGRRSRYVPIDGPPPTVIEAVGTLAVPSAGLNATAWLAGILEGEGTFEQHRRGDHSYPRISIQMCDEDVVGRAAELLGSTNVWREEPPVPGWSATYGAAIVGRRAAIAMSDLLPYMGQRRSGEIQRALERYQPIRVEEPPRTCVVSGCSEPHRSRGVCHKHYMSWSRDLKHGRTPRVTPLR